MSNLCRMTVLAAFSSNGTAMASEFLMSSASPSKLPDACPYKPSLLKSPIIIVNHVEGSDNARRIGRLIA